MFVIDGHEHLRHTSILLSLRKNLRKQIRNGVYIIATETCLSKCVTALQVSDI